MVTNNIISFLATVLLACMEQRKNEKFIRTLPSSEKMFRSTVLLRELNKHFTSTEKKNSEYSTTMVHGTWKKLELTLYAHRNKKYFRFRLLYYDGS